MRARQCRPPSTNYCRFPDKGILVQTGNSLGRVSNRIFAGRETPSTGVRKVSYRRSIIWRIDGPSGRVPQGFVRRLRGDSGDRLRAILCAPSRAALPPPDRGVRLLRGAASDPRRAPAGCPAEDPRRAPDVRGADLRGAPGIRRRVEVDVVVSPPEADAPGPARADEAGTGERLHDQRPRRGPEAPPREPIELP